MTGGLDRLLGARVPSPPESLRRGPFRSGNFSSPLHSERRASRTGLWLGLAFLVCFVTGLISHLIQHPPGWFSWPASPAWLYRVTQGVHVATGLAAIPLFLVKLWTVYPRLFQTPVIRDLAHALERISLVPLIGGALFMLVTGVANIDLWYPWPFFFPAGHYWMAWITIGALVVHVGAKITVTRQALARSPAPRRVNHDRRRFLAFAAASSALLTVATIGQTVAPLIGAAAAGPVHQVQRLTSALARVSRR